MLLWGAPSRKNDVKDPRCVHVSLSVVCLNHHSMMMRVHANTARREQFFIGVFCRKEAFARRRLHRAEGADPRLG